MYLNVDYVNLNDKKLMFDNYLVDLENMEQKLIMILIVN